MGLTALFLQYPTAFCLQHLVALFKENKNTKYKNSEHLNHIPLYQLYFLHPIYLFITIIVGPLPVMPVLSD